MNQQDSELPANDDTSDGEIGWRTRGHGFNIALRRVSRGHMRCITVGAGIVLAAIATAIFASAALMVLVGVRYFLD